MPLDEKKERFLDWFYPGLIEAVKSLGPGDFDAGILQINSAADGVRGVQLGCAYRTGKFLVDIRVRLRKDGAPWAPPAAVCLADWAPVYYRLHYGRPNAEPDTIFRFDLEGGGPHVHIDPDPKLHVPAADADPNTTNMDPRDFVAMVTRFRSSKRYPIKRK